MGKIIYLFIILVSVSSHAAMDSFELAKYQKKHIDSLYSRVMSQDFKVEKNEKVFKEYLRGIVFVSSQSKDHYMGSYIAELIEDKKIDPKYVWSKVSQVSTPKQLKKLKRDYLIDNRSGLRGQDLDRSAIKIKK